MVKGEGEGGKRRTVVITGEMSVSVWVAARGEARMVGGQGREGQGRQVCVNRWAGQRL